MIDDGLSTGTTSEDVGSEGTPPDSSLEGFDLVAEAKAQADRIEKANKVQAELLARQEQLVVRNTLGGKASVNIVKKEESDEDYAKRVMANDL